MTDLPGRPRKDFGIRPFNVSAKEHLDGPVTLFNAGSARYFIEGRGAFNDIEEVPENIREFVESERKKRAKSPGTYLFIEPGSSKGGILDQIIAGDAEA